MAQRIEGNGVDLCEVANLSFIVRLWLDPTPPRPEWGGYVLCESETGEPKRLYVRNLRDLEMIIGSRLVGRGLTLGLLWRLRYWLWRRRSEARL